MKRRIGVDVDGVLRDWETAIKNMVRTHYPHTFVNGVQEADQLSSITTIPITDLRHLFSVTHVDEVYVDSKPYVDAGMQFGMLQTYAKFAGHDIVCVSHQWDGTISATMKWLGQNGFAFKEIHFTKEKYNVDVDFLVDDSPRNYDEWVAHGRAEHMFVLFNRPYNKLCPASRRIDSLTDVIRIIN